MRFNQKRCACILCKPFHHTYCLPSRSIPWVPKQWAQCPISSVSWIWWIRVRDQCSSHGLARPLTLWRISDNKWIGCWLFRSAITYSCLNETWISHFLWTCLDEGNIRYWISYRRHYILWIDQLSSNWQSWTGCSHWWEFCISFDLYNEHYWWLSH